jgi:uncharacterized membrane protein/mono/diheme cytochrome c family protein
MNEDDFLQRRNESVRNTKHSRENPMNRIILSACCALAVSVSCGPAAVLAAEPERNRASDALSVFSAKCTGCHGPNLARPKGRFGYVLDLARVAANREMVVPSSPEESELWELVRRGEMPPEDSPTGPLSEVEKEKIHAWIAAGAPAESIDSAAADPPETKPASSPPSLMNRMLHRVGPFHLVAVHFPIALLIVAAASEFRSTVQGSRIPTPAVRFCVLLGAVAALTTASLGWIHAANGHGAGAPQILGLHRWLGTTAAVWAVGTALISEWDERRGVRSVWFRASLFVGALLVAVEGHFGGMLVHGDDFLTGG